MSSSSETRSSAADEASLTPEQLAQIAEQQATEESRLAAERARQEEEVRLAAERAQQEEAARAAQAQAEASVQGQGQVIQQQQALPQAPAAVFYPNCAAVRAAGAAPIYAGDPGYGRHLDRDGDGVGCE